MLVPLEEVEVVPSTRPVASRWVVPFPLALVEPMTRPVASRWMVPFPLAVVEPMTRPVASRRVAFLSLGPSGGKGGVAKAEAERSARVVRRGRLMNFIEKYPCLADEFGQVLF